MGIRRASRFLLGQILQNSAQLEPGVCVLRIDLYRLFKGLAGIVKLAVLLSLYALLIRSSGVFRRFVVGRVQGHAFDLFSSMHHDRADVHAAADRSELD